jgi:hypothetical protein
LRALTETLWLFSLRPNLLRPQLKQGFIQALENPLTSLVRQLRLQCLFLTNVFLVTRTTASQYIATHIQAAPTAINTVVRIFIGTIIMKIPNDAPPRPNAHQLPALSATLILPVVFFSL